MCARRAVLPIVLLSLVSVLLVGEETDYERAYRSFEKGDKVFARIYFEGVLENPDDLQHHRDAVYFLARIHSEKGEALCFISYAARFLGDYPHDLRASEVFDLLLKKLIEKGAFVLAADYLQEYEYLAGTDSLLCELGYGLVALGKTSRADYVFALCPQNDTVKVVRAFLSNDYQARNKMLSTLEGPARDLYLTENYLMMGDTIRAFLKFREVKSKDLGTDGLYRFVKIALLFGHDNVREYIAQLAKQRSYKQKSELLFTIAECKKEVSLSPADDEEIALYVQIGNSVLVSKEPPENLLLDSLLLESSDTLGTVQRLTRQYSDNYYIDSLYCQLLMSAGRYDDAARNIAGYLNYCNTQDYARKVQGYQYYTDKDHGNAATNLILSKYRSPPVLYVLAECLRLMDYEAGFLYRQVMNETTDSSLYFNALSGFIRDRYGAEDYQSLCALDFGALRGDTALIKLYTHSLARCGRRQLADSLHQSYFGEDDPALLNFHGLYMIEREEYSRAQAYYDSIVQVAGGNDELLYNWALISFLNNDMETARQRFDSYVTEHPAGPRLHDVFFKIATLNYLVEAFDSAAYYYGLASADVNLVNAALKNQLICYKKAGDWAGVTSTGQRILVWADEAEKADILFDVGYAYLRAGRVKEAIKNIGEAARLKSDPRFYYWLGEAYLGKGDFARSFYSYRKIIDLHGDDEMWVPTAQYKTGVVLELMDEIDAARAVYEALIKKKGTADPIGAEANIRLKHLQP